MAKQPKQNNKPSKAKENNQDSGRVMSILRKEYAFENWLLAILSPVLILYGVYIVSGTFGTVNLAALLGNTPYAFINFFFATDLARILTGSFLILIGTLIVIYLLIPYLRPSLAEMKKVTWPTSRTLTSNSVKVIGFILFLGLFFVLIGFALNPLFEWIYSL